MGAGEWHDRTLISEGRLASAALWGGGCEGRKGGAREAGYVVNVGVQ